MTIHYKYQKKMIILSKFNHVAIKSRKNAIPTIRSEFDET